ncbi:hypothetical protein [Tenacibaculum maritimum]|uniref:hypothetical protein n=1 Tax=Tenacibaculum maritimum TaxID=107401 RepID=UPI0004061D9F|nr:hypothetical protein [Tenacibaculum maritimum]MCD9562549.1 hypothetical protein [Tenacibaculum maritimum]MCD9565977.1 hypothetical protein [Tenacibaculum maritimum]MCD9577720.1 hypothetical protein [Tenacibaculum maritimum]MCD9597882.1 hypothetical protein [Tenacibaculum maritimum]MCD9613501.1 hypothetical protein [Tenacibaculum maritimum]
MKAYGYIKGTHLESPSELREVTLLLSINEIEDVITFLQKIKKTHKDAEDITELCHTHLSDVIKKYRGEVDVIIATKN